MVVAVAFIIDQHCTLSLNGNTNNSKKVIIYLKFKFNEMRIRVLCLICINILLQSVHKTNSGEEGEGGFPTMYFL